MHRAECHDDLAFSCCSPSLAGHSPSLQVDQLCVMLYNNTGTPLNYTAYYIEPMYSVAETPHQPQLQEVCKGTLQSDGSELSLQSDSTQAVHHLPTMKFALVFC